jgi:hypothetical protein
MRAHVGRPEASGMELLEARAERYRQEAARIQAQADRTRNPEARTVLLDIARQYETLATMTEQMWPYR